MRSTTSSTSIWTSKPMFSSSIFLDGLEAARLIRKRESDSGVPYQPIVAMTAHALDEHREASRLAGMDDHITKPVNVKDLERMLDTWSSQPSG